jgi:quercetin dioxygenase-like cupin family protein
VSHSGAVRLAEWAEELQRRAGGAASARAAHTVATAGPLRQTLMALRSGAELAEHDSPAGATLQVVRGRARLTAGEQTWEVGDGELVAITPRRHRLTALTDTVVLLTATTGG